MFEAKKNGKTAFNFYSGIERNRHPPTGNRAGVAAGSQAEPVHCALPAHLPFEFRPSVPSEALVRWNHPQKGLILPAQFIQVAEESELIIEIGRWVIEECCAQLSRWSRRGART